jgi:hypothetical protein
MAGYYRCRPSKNSEPEGSANGRFAPENARSVEPAGTEQVLPTRCSPSAKCWNGWKPGEKVRRDRFLHSGMDSGHRPV